MSLPLRDVVAGLAELAPLELAAEWDNVGLLLEPPPGSGEQRVSRVLLTIDLSEAVLDEAILMGAELVVAYHPVIFSGVKRLTLGTPEGRILLRAIEHRLAVYSPHTALDSVFGGVNDWLADAVGDGLHRPIEPAAYAEGAGLGRFLDLREPVALDEAVGRIKKHLNLSRVRVASAERHARGEPIRSVAVCPGAGGSLLSGLRGPELFLTGEMRHHDVREHVARGASVVLCDHTNTERGYLPHLAEVIRTRWPQELEVVVSERDRDPLEIT